MGRLDGKVAIVTGAAVGIGFSTALRMAQEGASVAVLDIQDGSHAVETIGRGNGVARYWQLDTTNEGSVKDVFAEVVQAFGKLDVLVNNAGIAGANKPTHELTEAEWDNVMDVNVKGVFFCVKHAVPHMRQGGGGSIINVSSVYGWWAPRTFLRIMRPRERCA
jgi:NAD(P)-dependent dehydrogenase (short-subunit alcohol dehydrogenase family)